MILTAEQNRALNAIHAWRLSSSSDPFCLGGYAGTGKTTLLQHLINSLDSSPICCCPTGKAASVLQKKIQNAVVTTVHRALYCPVTPSTATLDKLRDALLNDPTNQELMHEMEQEQARLAKMDLKFSLNKDHGIAPGMLVIVDEASMVTGKMLTDLVETGARIIFVGDPEQLPPVQDTGFFDSTPPDVMLTEVQRQALENPIVRLSMLIRNDEEPWGTFSWGDENGGCTRLPKSGVDPDSWLGYQQVLTGKNETRRQINRWFRGKLGRLGKYPVQGDRLICLKNGIVQGRYFTNGIPGYAAETSEYNKAFQLLNGKVLYEGDLVNLPLYRYPFEAHYDKTAQEQMWQERSGFAEFDYAYAITVHKSQGSEWDKVLLADDQLSAGQKTFRRRWLYTAITRAKKELMWVV